MTTILTDTPIHYRGGTFLYNSDPDRGPDFFTITCPDGFVSDSHCVSTATSLSVIELLHMSGHGHKPNPACDNCNGTGFRNTVKCRTCGGNGKQA